MTPVTEGQRIIVVEARNEEEFYKVGDTGTVIRVDDGGETLYIRFDTPRKGDTDWWVMSYEAAAVAAP